MNDPKPPPVPPPPLKPGQDAPGPASGNEVYTLFEQKIGGVPNLRVRDNLYQGVSVAICLALGCFIGWRIEGGGLGAILGTVGGAFAGLIVSGIVLMILGWTRKR